MNKLILVTLVVLIICVLQINGQFGWNNGNSQQGQQQYPNNFPNFPTPYPIDPKNVNTRFAEETSVNNNGQQIVTRRVNYFFNLV